MSKDKSQPTICVLVAAYNGEEWIQTQIETILSQQNVTTTIYISDDYSADHSYDKCLELQKKQQNIHILRHASRLGGAARNFFWLLKNIDFSAYDFIAFSDQDDLWFEDKLHNAVQQSSLHNADAYSSNVIAFWPDGSEKMIHKAQAQKPYDFMFESAGPGCTFVLSKRLALEVQSFIRTHDEACLEVDFHDWFIYAFARSRGYRWFIDPVPGMLYRQHAHNVVGANSGVKAMIARWRKLNQGWFSQQVLVIANLLGYADQWPIRRLTTLTLIDRLVLAMRAGQLRRRLRDQCALALYFLWIAKSGE